jgi:hypothetical protein
VSVGRSTWGAFRDAVFGDPYLVWHDGPDYAVLRQRWRDEPHAVTQVLVLGLEQHDELAAQAIALFDRNRHRPACSLRP